jgi:lipopolysaccharide export system protein LptA
VPGGESKIERVEAYGNVEIRTEQEVVRGERGIYSPVTGLARLLGNVRITRGENHLNGQEAIVNLRTGVSRLVSAPGQRVQGLVVPQQQQPAQPQVPNPQVPAQPPSRQSGSQQGRGR